MTKKTSENSLRICIVAPFNVLSNAEGASIRVFKLAQGLSDCGALVIVLHYGPARTCNNNFIFIKVRNANPITSATNYVHPFNFFFPHLFKKVLKEYSINLVQFEQPWSTLPAKFYLKHFEIPYVLDEHNVEYLWSAQASKLSILSPINYAIEKSAIYDSATVLATSEIDKNLLKKIYGLIQKDIIVIPNGVDTERFSMPSVQSSFLRTKLQLNQSSKIIVFHGLLSAKQNYEAAKLIVTFIAPYFQDDTFIIIGKNPPNWLKIIAEKQKNVRLLGFVQILEEYILGSDVCIAPIKVGSGTRLKILDYLAAGKPIVATYKAVEGLNMVDGVHALLHQDVNAQFVESLRQLLSNKKLSNELSKNASFLSKEFNWCLLSSKLFAAIKEVIKNEKPVSVPEVKA